MKESKLEFFPISITMGDRPSLVASTTQFPVGVDRNNMSMQIKRADKQNTAREESVPSSDHAQPSGLSTEAVAGFWDLQPPCIYENPADQERLELKVPVSDPDAVIPEALDANNVEPVEWTSTISDDVEMGSSDATKSSSGLDEGSVRERLEDGILDDLGAHLECEQKHLIKTPLNDNETCVASNSRHSSKDKLAVMKTQALEDLLASEAGQYCTSLKIQWDILGFMEDQYRDHDFPNASLGQVITISGSAQYAQAATCSEYIRQNWPAHGSEILDALQDALDNPSHTSQLKVSARINDRSVSSDGATSSDAELKFDIIQGFMVLNIKSKTPDIIVDIFHQLVWMGAALRTSRDGGVQYCESKLERVLKARGVEPAIFNVTFDMSSPVKEDQSCWFPLFTNPVIAHGFPTAHRNDHEVGLEIPLAMMAALGGARHAVDFEGGLVLKGHSTMFVPLKRYHQSIQWHLIRRRDEHRILYREVSNECPNRAMIQQVDHEALLNTRAFLGWWPWAETHLGTADAPYHSIDWSPAGAAKRSARFSGANIGFQTMITGQLTFIMGKKDGRLHLSQKGPFQRIVQCAEITPVVLYDPADRRAWFVFGLHLMLHIIQTRHHLSPYNIDGQKVELTPVHPDKGKGAATEAVAANKLRQLYECDTNAEKAYYFKDAILDIWSQMERLMEKENSIEACPGLALHGTMQSRIHGWEYMSLVHEKNYQRKEANIAKSSGGWVDLINDNDALVLFATGLDEIIKPVSNLSNLCRPWRSLPKGKDYLAAGVPILELLYSEAGSRISRKHLSTSHLQWHRGSTLFEQCKGTTSFRCECDRTQQIYHDSLLKTFGHVRPPGNLRENGCVIFGQAHHPFKLLNTTAIRQNAVHILPNTSIQNGDNTKQVSVGDDGLLSLSPPASVSPVPEEINYYTNRDPERPPSPVSSTEDTVHENVVVRRRNMSHIQTSNFDTRSGPNDGENELSLSDDCATLGYKSTLRHDTLFNGQYSGSTQTLCASKIEFRPVHTRKTLRHKSKMKDYSHRHGSSCKTSCKTCSTVDSEPPDSIERVSMSNGSQGTSKNAAERRER